MVDWDPIMGVIPPLDENDWQTVFDQYKQFPEYQKVNFNMEMEEFKSIFYMEYAHRVFGRLIGLVFLVPLIFFLIKKYIKPSQLPRFAIMFVLGGLQGLLGWYMVKSGLVDRPSVSQYRLSAHLILAVTVYCYMLWTALSVWRQPVERYTENIAWLRWGWLVFAMIMLMIVSGGFVAGTRAGFVFNTFPLIMGQWVPDGLWQLDPAWRNLFENVITVQFVHRWFAMLIIIFVLVWFFGLQQFKRDKGIKLISKVLLLALVLQIALGVSTLLLKVPTVLGVFHQAGAIALVTVVMISIHCLRYRHY